MHETISLFVSMDTSLADIQLLRNEMKRFVVDPDNKRDFLDDIDVQIVDLHEMDKLEISIDIKHKSNWANETVRASRRSKFMCALVLAFRKVPIYGPGGGDPKLGFPGNPTVSVSINAEEAARARDEAARGKEAARLVPTKKEESAGAASTSELRVVTSLNERSPALDGARDAGSLREDVSGDPPRGADVLGAEAEEQNILRRQTTLGRRRGGEVSGLAMAGMPTMTSASLPDIGVTAPTPVDTRGPGPSWHQSTQTTSSDEDWYGTGDEAEMQQLEPMQPPPLAARPSGAR